MCVGTDSKVVCCRCGVERAELQTGQWCGTCGYNPKYEAQIKKLEDVLQSATLIEAEGVQLMIMPLWKDRHPGNTDLTPKKDPQPLLPDEADCEECGDHGCQRPTCNPQPPSEKEEGGMSCMPSHSQEFYKRMAEKRQEPCDCGGSGRIKDTEGSAGVGTIPCPNGCKEKEGD